MGEENQKDQENNLNDPGTKEQSTPEIEEICVSDLIAERDSLKEDYTKLTNENAALKAELAETKKLNYTLARQVDAGTAKKETAEDIIKSIL